MTGAAAVQRTLSSLSRVRILHVLQNTTNISIDELCERSGLHPNTVREHINRLIDDGFVLSRLEPRSRRGRPRVLYNAARGDEGADTVQGMKVRAAHERSEVARKVFADLPRATDAPAVMRQLDALDDHLDQVGFEPVIDQANRLVELNECPFREMVAQNPRVVCAVHLGLIQMVMAQADGPATATEIRPFVQPEQCHVMLNLGHA